MAATFGKYPSLDKQWRKMMFSFYPYLSTKNRNATQEEWKIRRLIWDFKDGKAFANVAHLVANKLIQLYGKETNNIIFACVPASSAEKNEKRYKHFSSMVCELCGMYNAYDHIKVKGEKSAEHDNVSKSEIHNKQEIEFDQDFFKGRKVIVFDDILTKGFAYAIFANKIEKMGAEVLGGLFIGKTVYSN